MRDCGTDIHATPWPRRWSAFRACGPVRRLWQAVGLLLAGAALLLACDPDLPAAPDAGGEAGTCRPGDATSLAYDRLLVTTEQYGSGGGVTVIDLESWEPSLNVALTSDDVTARWFDRRIYVLNRYGADNVMVLRDDTYALVTQVSVRPGDNEACNPHDLLFLSTCRAYLTCYEQPVLYAFDPSGPAGVPPAPAVDLAPLADGDGVPEASHMAKQGNLVYVALERLDRTAGWVPRGPSRLALVDPESDVLVGDLALQGLNPVGPLRPIPGTRDLLLACAGDWSGAGAGLERVHTALGTSAWVVTAEALGGIPTAVTLGEDGCGFALVTTPGTYETAVMGFCLDGSVKPCIAAGQASWSDVLLGPDGALYVTDRSLEAPGVRVFDPADCTERTPSPIPTGFPPGFTNPMLLLPQTGQ